MPYLLKAFPNPRYVTGSECRYIYWCSVAERGKKEGKGFSGIHCGMNPPQERAPQVAALACHPVAGGAVASHGALRP